MAANSVVQALKVLQDAGREDLIKEGVLEQAWVGLKRPKRLSAERVTAAVLACKSPKSPKKLNKFREKSVAGRKVSVSPERSEGSEEGLLKLPDFRGGARLTRRSGSFLRQRVAAMGRGSSVKMVPGAGRGKPQSVRNARSPNARTAVLSGGRMVACGESVSAFKRALKVQKAKKQAPLAVESGREHGEEEFEERALGGAAKMAVPSGEAHFVFFEPTNSNVSVGQKGGAEILGDNIIIIDSEEEGEIEEIEGWTGKGNFEQSEVMERACRSRRLQWVPRVVSPVVRRVQEWERDNMSVFKAGEQVEFVDEQGTVIRGTISRVSSDGGRLGPAQVRLDLWQQGARAYLSGCNQARAPEQHGLALEGQRLGRPADLSVPVGVRAPPGHRFEERVQSGAVCPTARETSVHELESSDHVLQDTRVTPASRSASTGLVHNEEELDYEDETMVRAVSAPKTKGQAVQGDRLSSRREVVGGLRRGEVSGETGLLVSGESNLERNANNVDVAIEVETRVGLNESKPEGSLNATQVVTGKSVEGQVSTGDSVTVGQAGSKGDLMGAIPSG
ncbi:hypothetical protein NDU88_005853 [Pleurodeles waltl]|uniref:Uncharacterized protein n=1 Tax=Pleurodeles waltl TaxID=8319 RepID=A0AAV7WWF3_PLEWA|nr:hypothetical protein NDU88_005853 [Pleurodeles waltl]